MYLLLSANWFLTFGGNDIIRFQWRRYPTFAVDQATNFIVE